MTAKTRKPLKHKKLIIVLSVILSVVIVITTAAVVFLKVGEARLREKLTFNDDGLTEENAYGDNAEVFYKGQGYVYNENLINILCIGVDKKNTDKKDRQADALFLLSLDTETNIFNIIAISRNTLADIDVYDMNNEFLSSDRAQICLSYVYGKDDEDSTKLTCKAVSRLLYNVPINAYCTVFLNSIADIVDSVGGVEVVIPDDMTEADKSWYKGKRVKLNGNNALKFLQYRGEHHAPRLERQKLFINNFVTASKKAFKKDLTLPIDVFKKLSRNSVTDIDISQVTYLATEIAGASFKMHSLEGKDGFDGMYETFEVDEHALYETVLDLFYIKTN